MNHDRYKALTYGYQHLKIWCHTYIRAVNYTNQFVFSKYLGPCPLT